MNIEVDNSLVGIAGTQFKNWRDVSNVRVNTIALTALSPEEQTACADKMEAARLSGEYRTMTQAARAVCGKHSFDTMLKYYKRDYNKKKWWDIT